MRGSAMHCRSAVRLLCLAAMLAVGARSSAAVETSSPLRAFSSVKSCLPFNVLLQPTEGNATIDIDAPSAVADALSADVADGELVLSLGADLALDGPAKVRVAVPSGSLEAVANTGPATVLLDAFAEQEIVLTNEFTGMVAAVGGRFESLKAFAIGLGKVFVSGSIGEAMLTSERGAIFLDGAEGSVIVEDNNTFFDSVFTIKGASDAVSISGKGARATKVVYDVGSCEVSNGNKVAQLARSVCELASTEGLAAKADKYEGMLLWTCAVTAEADEGCAAPVQQPTSSSTGMAMGVGPTESNSTAMAGAGGNVEGMTVRGSGQTEAEASATDAVPQAPVGCSADADGSKMLQ